MIRPLSPADRDSVLQLLQNNPHKRDQIRFQNLDTVKLGSFHRERLYSQAESSSGHVLVWEENGKVGVLGLSISKNHSNLFQKLVISVSPVLTYSLEGIEKASFLHEILEDPFLEEAEILEFRFAEEEGEWIPILGRLGGSYCGTELRLTRPLAGTRSRPAETGLRPAEEGDLERLEEIAKRGHAHSHFFRNPYLGDRTKRELFPAYLRESYGRESRLLWVVEGERGTPEGFALVILPEGQEKSLGRRIAILDFIVVDPRSQGKGMGHRLLDGAHRIMRERGYEYVELKTMLDNRTAINFYHRNGYHLVSSEVHYCLGLGGE